MTPNAQELPIPENQRIEILIRNLDHRQIQGMLIDFFGPKNSPTKPIFVIFNASWKPRDQNSVDVAYKNFQIVEGNEDPNVEYKVLADIIMQRYPNHTVFFIDPTNIDKGSWRKITLITKEIISKMQEFEFELISVKPTGFFTETAPIKSIKTSGKNDENKILNKSIKLPKSAMVIKKWKKVWQLIAPRIDNGEATSKISIWLESMHPDLPSSRATLSKIIKLGLDGKLDNRLSPKNKQT